MNTPNIDLNKVKDRIAKLLRMAQDSSSPNEAAIAADRARHLMDTYQISSMDLGDTADNVFTKDPVTGKFRDIPMYMSVLSVSVAKLNDCQAAFEYEHVENGVKKFIVFKGFKDDVELGNRMYNRLLNIINKLAREYVADKFPGETIEDMDVLRASTMFKCGASDEICNRLRKMTIERDCLTMSGGTSLVLCKRKAVDDHFGEAAYTESRSRRLSKREIDARNAGVIKGAAVAINPEVK